MAWTCLIVRSPGTGTPTASKVTGQAPTFRTLGMREVHDLSTRKDAK